MLLPLLFACVDPPETPSVSSPHKELDPAHPPGPLLTLVEPAAGFVVTEGDIVVARAAWVGRESTVAWTVNGAAVPGCTSADELTCTISNLTVGSVEICVAAESVDRSCAAGRVDPCTASLWYPDFDGDGFGNTSAAARSCTAPVGAVRSGGDCDDADPTIHPDATEVCNAADDDCDTLPDNDAIDATVWYRDADGDGHGTPADGVRACAPPTGHVALADDCDDTDPTVSPDRPELCNGEDDNCDGAVDVDAVDLRTWYADADADGYGDRAAASFACAPFAGTVADATDCDDTRAVVHPGAAELCNDLDDNCDGATDEPEADDAASWYADDDGDGFGDPTVSIHACHPPGGFAASGADCDDTDAAVSPAGVETCDGRDENCDGATDGPEAVDAARWYADTDTDGFGLAADYILACAEPADRVASHDDCDDSRASVNPAATEQCNGHDDNCDGWTDEPDAADALTWYADTDADGFGDALVPRFGCAAPPGTVADATDCDDRAYYVHPDAIETCDDVDENCDGRVDEAEALDVSTWYADTDADGFGDAGSWVVECAAPDGYVRGATDCDDADATAWPGATERIDGTDDDCDGTIDEVSAPWQTDLVQNGGFELGDLTGWTHESGGCEVVDDRDLDWIAAYEGDYMLHGGTSVTTDCLVSQELDLTALGMAAEDLDSGHVAVDALGVLAHEMSSEWFHMPSAFDRTLLRVVYVSDSGEELGSLRTLLSQDDGWAVRGVTGVLPVGTRILRVELQGMLRKGIDVDAVADAVSLSVGPITPSSPTITKLPFLQDYRQDAMRLLWETDANRAVHVVEWAPTGEALTNTVTLVDTVEVDATHHVHVATIEGLSAGTEYDYRVGSGDTWSRTYTFRTAPAAGEPFNIGWVGDNEWGTHVFTGLLQGMLARDVDLYMSTGDVVWNGDEVADWAGEWFAPLEAASNFSQTHPVLFARGNHDDHHALSYAYSALPGPDPDWYSYTYGNIFFVVLDSDSPSDQDLPQLSQMEYLQTALTSDEALLADFRIVTFHHAPYTAARHDNASVGMLGAQADWVEIFEDNDVDLVISGHYHSYQRGEQNGVTYLIVGGGGGWLDDRPTGLYPFMSVVEQVHHYAMMEVDGPNLTWTAFDEDELVLDTFSLTAE
ncbi:MAG: MopE-related protein [Myxococcota bacterium]